MAERKRRGLITWPLALAVLALAVLDSASGDSANGNGTGPIPPSVFIESPENLSMVRQPSFEITGGFGGSVTSIEVFLDGESLGPARRGEVAGDWRIPASLVSLEPGLHRISATADGEAGRASAGHWVWYDPDSLFEIAIEPSTATYEPGERADDPDLLLLGSGVPATISVTTATRIDADTNPQLTAPTRATLRVNVRTEVPGEYPITVLAVADDGTERSATHTIMIAGTPPASSTSTTAEPPATTAVAGDPVAVLFDDFEGPDRWTAEVSSTNEATATAVSTDGSRRMEHDLPGTDDGEASPTQITVIHLFDTGWDPGADGPLSRIDYSEDQIEYEPPFDGAAIGTRFVVVQDGTTYAAEINEGNAFTNLEWQTVRVEGLTAADFQPPGLDLEAGGPMQFGYLRSNTSRSSAGIVTEHGIDNWTVALFRE